MKHIFINRNGKLRSGWKIGIAFGLFLALTGLVDLLLAKPALYIYSYAICLTATVILLWRLLDHKPIRDLGLINLKTCYPDLCYGLAGGALSVSLIYSVLLLWGSIVSVPGLSGPSRAISLLTGLTTFSAIGIAEELLVRGYCIAVLKQTGSQWAVLLVSALIFAAMHIISPFFTGLSFINLFLLGALLALMVFRTGNLWMSIGYHLTWNYFQGNIFGFRVSGNDQVGLLATHARVANVINGGNYGPEGSLVTTALLLLGIFILWKRHFQESAC